MIDLSQIISDVNFTRVITELSADTVVGDSSTMIAHVRSLSELLNKIRSLYPNDLKCGTGTKPETLFDSDAAHLVKVEIEGVQQDVQLRLTHHEGSVFMLFTPVTDDTRGKTTILTFTDDKLCAMRNAVIECVDGATKFISTTALFISDATGVFINPERQKYNLNYDAIISVA